MSEQPVLCPACAAPMRCMAWVTNVFKCDKCGFGTCLGSEVAAIDRRVEKRVDLELAEVREHAKALQRSQFALVAEIAARSLHRPTVGTGCPACGLVLTREPHSKRLDCAACGDHISIEWAEKYEEEITRLRAALQEIERLNTMAKGTNAAAAALSGIAAMRKIPEGGSV